MATAAKAKGRLSAVPDNNRGDGDNGEDGDNRLAALCGGSAEEAHCRDCSVEHGAGAG